MTRLTHLEQRLQHQAKEIAEKVIFFCYIFLLEIIIWICVFELTSVEIKQLFARLVEA